MRHLARTHGWRTLRPLLFAVVGIVATLTSADDLVAQTCERTITADVVALDQPVFYNRLGAYDPAGMMFALRRDVVASDGSGALEPGAVQLREDKRPRPLTLRMNVGDCLTVTLENLLDPQRVNEDQPATRTASIHAMGMQPVNGIADDGSNVGENTSSLVAPGEAATYTIYAEREGTYLLYSSAAVAGGEGDNASLSHGLFGAINVQPRGAEWYRGQVSAEDLDLATRKNILGLPVTTPDGQPVIDYDATYPLGHKYEGLPILKMLHEGEIIHSDLSAIITGPDKGNFPAGTYPEVAVAYEREQPYREFTVIFHDEAGLVQAFDAFEDPKFEHTLHSGRDAFAINYGTGGIGAEVLANRYGVGPMWDCNECKYEEFFLSSWTVGDPSMLVDIPANADLDGNGEPDPGPKASKVLYPDDPSNVFHSYLDDNVKIRNVHAGPQEHHVFHLHAHQWLHTPDSDNSTILDSQAIGPGGGYTYEMAWGGSGNRPRTPGDAVFHCHFYPHFAQGMWALWRNHDVMETGTELDSEGRPVAGARTLPDGEIEEGTPIPAVVPLPGRPLPPMPGTENNPGYPFYVPGVAGHRAPKPPLETAFDGGLPRHVVEGGEARFPALNTLDFSKDNVTLDAVALPEAGTDLEKAAMAFHAKHEHPTYTVDPVTFDTMRSTFLTNGLEAAPGAPYADPCVDRYGKPVGTARVYKGASFQMDVKFNKAGWHFPQHRMFGLWEDVVPTLNGQRAPEPMFLRSNTYDCIEYRMVNLVPHEYHMDDFQVVTPTDVIGQHIHLVKFDVTSSDGGANGYNYEDGSLAPGEVRERIHAIREFNECVVGDSRDGTIECPVAEAHPFFGKGPNDEWVGAQETIQRWFADDVLNAQGEDRTLRTIFTHDHFGPSTHQQTGLYAALAGEPAGSEWRDPETGDYFGTRHDGGPTSWRADILTADPDSSYREYLFQVADFTLGYRADNEGYPDPGAAINPPGKFDIGLPYLLAPPAAKNACPNGDAPPCPELVSADDPGSMVVNYRNDPLALRVRDPSTNTQADGTAGDLSYAFKSDVTRADSRLNTQPGFYPPLTGGVEDGDPYTPLIRAYEGDRIQVRTLVGAHEEGHHFNVFGTRWLFEPSDTASGFRSSQMMGISEHFEFVLPPLPKNSVKSFVDYLYTAGSSTDDLWNGLWGLMRVYLRNESDFLPLPNNDGGNFQIANAGDFNGVCPKSAPVRSFDITAVQAKTAFSRRDSTLVYNPRTGNGGKLHDPTAILFARTSDLHSSGEVLRDGVPAEPLILRANAGDCIELRIRNELPAELPDLAGYNTLPMVVDSFNANQVAPSSHVGLRPQMLSLDASRSAGANVGFNLTQTAKPDNDVRYQWYAGELLLKAGDTLEANPVEFGAINLIPSDPIKHASKGAVGALIIEPEGAEIHESSESRAEATIVLPDGSWYREFVLLFQDDLNLRYADGSPVPNLGNIDDPEDTGQKAFNYRTEPLWKRMGYAPDKAFSATDDLDYTDALSNSIVGGEDPVTPVFKAKVGSPVRFRVLQPGGHGRDHTFTLHGHTWEELPFEPGSREIGSNPLSEWKGSQDGFGATTHYNILPKHGAGGAFGITGDYLYRDFQSTSFDGGLWGVFRVIEEPSSVDCSDDEQAQLNPDVCLTS